MTNVSHFLENVSRKQLITSVAVLVILAALAVMGVLMVESNADYICIRPIDYRGQCTNGSWTPWTVISTTTDPATGVVTQTEQRTYTGQRMIGRGSESYRCSSPSGTPVANHFEYEVCQIVETRLVTTRPNPNPQPGCTGNNCPPTTIITPGPTTRTETDGAIIGGSSQDNISLTQLQDAILKDQEQGELEKSELKVTPQLVQGGNTTQVFWKSVGATACTVDGENSDHWDTLQSPTDGYTSKPIPSQTDYVLKCSSAHGASVTRKATVKIVPVVQEH